MLNGRHLAVGVDVAHVVLAARAALAEVHLDTLALDAQLIEHLQIS